MITALQTLAARVQAPAAEIAALPPAQRPSGTFPDRLAVNDMSLPWGGLFDLEGTWHHPHKEHRRGIEADVRCATSVRHGTTTMCGSEASP